MTDSDPREHDAVLLAAWLAGDLDDDDAAALEARMGDEPALADRADQLADLAVRLRGLEDVEPPAGFGERLRERIEAERAVPTLVGRRRRSQPAWQTLGAVAAALVAVVAVGGVLTGVVDVGGSDEQVAMEAGTAEDTEEQGAGAMSLESDVARAQQAPAADERATGAAVPLAPEIVDASAVVADEAALRAHLTSLPIVDALLGTGLDEADDLALGFRSEIQRAAPFASGVQPAACLDEVTAGAAGPQVPVRVEQVAFAGEPALLYVLVDARSGSDLLDRVTAWVVTPDRCETRLFAELSPAE